MSRPLRILYPNACYHVMNRGAGKKNIFNDNLHRYIFLELLNECHQMFGIIIHAYCLMDNHYHLLLSTPYANLSRAIRHLNGVYTQRYNRLTESDGPLFRGRYAAQLVDDDCYQLIVSRYIHLNPVKANLVGNAADYKWSSYRAYLGLVNAPVWLSMDIISAQITASKTLSHVKNYQQYVENDECDEINRFIGTKFIAPIVGSKAFKTKILSQVDATKADACKPDINRSKIVPEINTIIKHVCNYYSVNCESLMLSQRGQLNWPRLVCIYMCRKRFGHPIREISKFFGSICHVTISTAIQKCAARLNQNNLADEINVIYDYIMNEMLQGST